MADSSLNPLALVTGASSGIGLAFAERLARDRYDLVVVARRVDRLADLASRLAGEHPIMVELMAADLSTADGLRAVEARVARDGRLEMLVNNAGMAHSRPTVELAPADIDAMIGLHAVAVARLTRAALPGMVAVGRGSIVNVASIAGFLTGPGAAGSTYAATKAFITTFTQAVQQEVADSGVRLQALCPGWTRSEMLDLVPFALAEDAIMDAAALVDASLAGLRNFEVVCVPSLDDPTLLEGIDELKREVVRRSAATGTPAVRYAARPPW